MTDKPKPPSPTSLLALEAIREVPADVAKLCPKCQDRPAIEGGRCLLCRGEAMRP